MFRNHRLARLAATLTALAVAGILTGVNQHTTVLASTQATDAVTVTPAAPGLTFGIAYPALASESPTAQKSAISVIKSIGITSVRIDADWAWVQPTSANEFDWSVLDQEVKVIRAAGLTVDLIIDGCPPWAAVPGTTGDASPQPASSAQFATWAADVARRYAPEGVRYFEIWNEPNIVAFWQPKPNPVAYSDDLIAAYKAIKDVDSSAFVVSGGLSPSVTDADDYSPVEFLEDMYHDGVKGSFDALGYHPYSYPVAPDTYEPWSGWSQMSATDPSIRSVMADNGDSDKKVWITEFGAPSSGISSVGTAGQATQIGQALGAARSNNWIGAIYIYTWQDSSTADAQDNGFGLLAADGSPKPACGVVASVLRRQQGGRKNGEFVLKYLTPASACSFLSG